MQYIEVNVNTQYEIKAEYTEDLEFHTVITDEYVTFLNRAGAIEYIDQMDMEVVNCDRVCGTHWILNDDDPIEWEPPTLVDIEEYLYYVI